MKKIMYRADYVTETDIDKAKKEGLALADLDLSTFEHETLRGARDGACALNFISKDECYHLRRVEWEPKFNQYTPQEYYDCFDLRPFYENVDE